MFTTFFASIKIKYTFFAFLLSLVLCPLNKVFAGDLIVNNCDGSLLSATTLEEGKTIDVKLKSEGQILLTNTATSEKLVSSEVGENFVLYRGLVQGIYKACGVENKNILAANFQHSANTLALVSALVGVGGVVALMNSDGDNNFNGEERPIPPSTTQNPEVPGPSDISKPRPINTGKNCDDKKNNGNNNVSSSGNSGVSISALDECRNTEDTDALSAYR